MSARKVLGIFCLTLILLLTATATGSAQDTKPPKPPGIPVQPPLPPGKFPHGEGPSGWISQIPLQTASSPVSSQALTLGAVGLSYRYVQTFGITGIPYFSDTAHLNRPMGLFMDGSNNLYVAESVGERILKYNLAGSNLLSLGTAGVCITDDYTFCSSNDMALDGSGNLWAADGNRVVEYDSSGTFMQQLPATEPWNPGDDNTHFDSVNGIAFDSAGRMFVSDTNNQRVQVYTFTAGTPVYSATIGVTGITGSDNVHFNIPLRLTVDSSNRVYVVDQNNNRVQRCIFSSGWVCSTFDSGLNTPQGITVDGSNNIYIADTFNGRIRKCSSVGVCTDFATGTIGFYDLAVDSSGNVYGAAAYEDIVVKYNSSGGLVGTFLGTEFVPYLTDNYHYFHPRVAIDNSNNIIIVEENGHRLTKLNASGVALWSFGIPGVDAQDNNHLNYPHGVATDSSGKIYVADNYRVQIFSPDGTYLNTIGTGWGTGDYEFGWVTGVDVDKNGNVYVADYSNDRIEIFNNSRVFIGRIGATGDCSTANNRLCHPIAVDVDANGNIYVTDASNLRVQKFNSSHVWQMTIGDGTWGTSFNQLAWPEDIVVDAQGRIFVTDWSNNRVQVFDDNGAYLTTIGGSWGSNTSQLKGAPGIDVDSNGNVYVADWENHRIQEFAPGVPGWTQSNINGFGNPANIGAGQSALSTFGGNLYAGTGTDGTIAAQIWRSSDGQTWNQFAPGWGSANDAVTASQEFGSNLYMGTENVGGAEIWRTDGSTWTQVVIGGFSDTNNYAISSFAVFSSQIYAATMTGDGVLHIYRSTTGNVSSWTPVVSDGFGSSGIGSDTSMYVYGGYLYIGLNRNGVAELWRTNNGTTWSPVFTNGLATNNSNVSSMAELNGIFFIGLRNVADGGQVWKSTNGTAFSPVFTGGLGDPNNKRPYGMYVFNCRLYLLITDTNTGDEVWRTANGSTWDQVGFGGWGDANNIYSDYYDKGAAVFNNSLFMGTSNSANGGEIWRSDAASPVCASINVSIGGTDRDTYALSQGSSSRQNFTGVNDGPVQIASLNSTPIIGAERVIYKVNGVNTSFWEMMALPDSQLNTTYWLPWYNNVDLDTQLRFGNVSGSTATVHVFIGGAEMTGSPFTLLTGQSTRVGFAGVNDGPVKMLSDVNIVAAERVIYKVNGVNTSFSEMMALPNSQLNTTYWLPWYNNVDLDTQLRFGNVSGSTATVHVFIGGAEMTGSPFTLLTGQSTRVSFAGVNNGPVKVISDVNIVAAERVIYKVNGTNTSFSEMMALPDSQLSTTYWMPWYNNVDLDTQLRFGNVSGSTATVHVFIGGAEMTGSPFTLLTGQSTRVSFAGVNNGPVKVISDVNIVAAERVIYKVNGTNTSFSEMMALPDSLLNTTYWLPWYNNVDLDTQLRFGVP